MDGPSSVDSTNVIPSEILEDADDVIYDTMPNKSKKIYKKILKEFRTWMAEKGTNSYDEKVLLVYFKELSTKMLPSTLWSRYSILNTMLKIVANVNISLYPILRAFLKKINVGFKAKKSKVFLPDELKRFIMDAPDDRYLEVKVAAILGITGACRRDELHKLTVENVTDQNTHLIINILDTKTHINRTFTVDNPYREIILKYMSLRPSNVTVPNIFLNYVNGKCTKQKIGINKIGSFPNKMAVWLGLPEPKLYTGHSFRRTSATILANAGASIETLKRHGGWKSAQVAEGYVEQSVNNKRKICRQITESINNQDDSTEVALTKKVKINNDNNNSTAASSSKVNNPVNVKLELCSLQ